MRTTAKNRLKQLIHLVDVSYITGDIFKIWQRHDLLEWFLHVNETKAFTMYSWKEK